MTKPTSEVKRRYNAKVYRTVQVYLEKDLVDQFKAKCKETGTSQASVVRDAIKKFLNE